ncbi:hypothetical protein [Fodinicola acaciae]|uniref:hypothetical protein n=1 Tax=Fodinicola acaciae TaxID=2681555 RepID=UPI0013D20C61|nr:hypothetical protein [Fodinicola acaciae]
MKLGRIGKDELVAVPRSADERLALLCRSLFTVAVAAMESRQAVRTFGESHGLPHMRVRFVGAEQEESIDVDLDSRETDALL